MRYLWLFLAIPFSLLGNPTHTGTKGLLNIVSADNEGVGHLQYIINLKGATGGVSDTNRWATGDFELGLGFSFRDYFSFNVTSLYLVDGLDGEGTSNTLSYGFGDTKLGFKFTPTYFFREYLGGFDFGIYPLVSFCTGDKWEPSGNSLDTLSLLVQKYEYYPKKGGLFRFFSRGKLDYGIKALFSYRVAAENPVGIHINLGYLTHNKSEKNELSYGTGVEFNYANFTPFVEITRSEGVSKRAIYISPGIMTRYKNSYFNVGLNFNINNVDPKTEIDTVNYIANGKGVTPSWRFNLSFGQGFDFIKPTPPPPIGTLAGKVTDKETGEPLTATINFPGIDTVIQTDTSGAYKIELAPGMVLVGVSKEGYKSPKGTTVIVKDGKTVYLSFELKKEGKPISRMMGKVIDKITEKPIIATLSFPGTDIKSTTTDSLGIYKLTVPPGTYILHTAADNYVGQTNPVVLKDGETLLKDFALIRKGEKITLRGIQFATGKAAINPIYYPILDEAYDLLKQYSNIRVEIRGHTDSVGDATYNLRLSQKRATSVMFYLINKGISPERLSAKGYGESMPVADNSTREGRARNRRIEFYVIGEE
jgi:outer membrane protein OmpA-like peptidoglycan-associated protein